MDSSYIMPFVTSVQRVFETMLQLPVHVGQPALAKTGEPTYDVSGIIGMSGDVEGTVVLSFPIAVAERVVALFTGSDLTHTHEDFPDAVGELVNMVSGNAKAQFQGRKVAISCPSVVIGKSHMVFGRKDVVTILLPCSSDVGDFAVEVAIRNSTLAAAKSAAGAADAAEVR